MIHRTSRLVAAAGVTALAVSAIGIGHAGAESDGGWTVDTEDCPDPDATNAPIEGTITIGSAMPLSGPVAAAFEPAARGFEAYVAYANENELLPGVTIEVDIQDDAYDPSLTPGVVQGLIDSGVHLFSGNIGTPQNQSVVDTINEECIPHLNLLTGDPAWGEDIEEWPWTTGLLTPYHQETRGYADYIAENYPDATVGTYFVNNDFGNVFIDAFKEAADEAGLTLGPDQSIEAGDNAPPVAQVSSFADEAPQVIVGVPLGVQCATFLAEIANAKATHPDWEPVVILTSTCASPLILGLAADAANGVISSASMGLEDVLDPAKAEVEGVAAYLAEMEAQGLADIVTTGGAGWNAAEVTVAILIKASESEAGLTQASIIEAARSLDVHPMLLRETLHNYVMNGEDDTYYSEDIQIVQYDVAAGHFTDIGEPYSYETSA
jgi:ABC-type branched-subunit amino acid transport system substrate-binding protein